jgi:hypothetical protein
VGDHERGAEQDGRPPGTPLALAQSRGEPHQQQARDEDHGGRGRAGRDRNDLGERVHPVPLPDEQRVYDGEQAEQERTTRDQARRALKIPGAQPVPAFMHGPIVPGCLGSAASGSANFDERDEDLFHNC